MNELKRTYEQYWRGRQSETEGRADCANSPNEIFESVALVLTEGERLLDVGCGNGTLRNLAAGRFKTIHGCDLSETALQQATQRGIISVCTDLNYDTLPYKEHSFDCVTCLEVIEHVVDPVRLLREMHRVLRPGGRLVLTTPNVRYFRNVLRLVVDGQFPHTTTDAFVWGGGHLHYFTRTDLRHLFNEVGFVRCQFVITPEQFRRSWKRHLLVKILGLARFGEWCCGGIAAVAVRE